MEKGIPKQHLEKIYTGGITEDIQTQTVKMWAESVADWWLWQEQGAWGFTRMGLPADTQKPKNPWLILGGPVGSGKTQLATLASTSFSNSIHGATGVILSGWMDSHRLTTMARSSRWMEDGLGKYLQYPLLVIDDLGTETLTDSGTTLAKLDEIINVRWGNQSPTIITTNLTPKLWAIRYGQRIASRLADLSRLVVVGPRSRRREIQR